MAFIKIENKTDEVEFIVFPSVFAEHGAKLAVDNVVRVKGKVNAKDKDGNVTSDVKLLAEVVELVSDEILESYESTGTKLAAPAAAPSTGRGRGRSRSSAERVYNGGSDTSNSSNGDKHGTGSTAVIDTPRVLKEPPKDPRKERLYILIEDTSDTEKLTAIRRLADIYAGMQDVVLVIKEKGEKRVLKMPFRVEVSEDLLGKLRELVGDNCVKTC